MTEALPRSQRGSQGKVWAAVAVVFALQLAVLFSTGHEPARVAPVSSGPPTFLLGDPRPNELRALENPMLFVLPHAKGFSGQSWMGFSPLEYHPKGWSEPARSLPLTADRLVETFARYIKASSQVALPAIISPEPELTYPAIPPRPRVRLPSALRIEGELAGRALLNPPVLPPVGEVSTNSVVEILVDPLGYVFSAMPATRAAGTNDDLALQIARDLRFAPVEAVGPDRNRNAPASMMQGTLIYEWRTFQPAIPEMVVP